MKRALFILTLLALLINANAFAQEVANNDASATCEALQMTLIDSTPTLGPNVTNLWKPFEKEYGKKIKIGVIDWSGSKFELEMLIEHEKHRRDFSHFTPIILFGIFFCFVSYAFGFGANDLYLTKIPEDAPQPFICKIQRVSVSVFLLVIIGFLGGLLYFIADIDFNRWYPLAIPAIWEAMLVCALLGARQATKETDEEIHVEMLHAPTWDI